MIVIRIKGTIQLYVKVLDKCYKVIINKQLKIQVNEINKPNPLLNKQIQPKPMPQPIGSFTQSPHKNLKQPATPEQHISLLTTQLTQLQHQHHKLSSKYQKSLKQLALIVKANETLKQDYDALQVQVNRLVEQRSQQHQARLKEYFQKQLDELNNRIHQLSQDKDRLQVENSSLRLKVSQYSLQKTTLSRQLQQVNRKYQNICSKQQALDPQQHDQSMKDTFLEQLKHKARLVDQLQEALHLMEQQKNTIQQSYEKRLQEILTLWNQLHIQGKRKGRLSEAKLYESSYVTEEAMGRFVNRHGKRRSENVEVQEKTYDVGNRQQAIYKKGLRLIKGGNDMLLPNSNESPQPINSKLQQQQHELSFYRQRINQLQQQNHHLSQVIQHLSNSNTPTHQLQIAYNKLQQQHQLLQQKYSSLRISNLLSSQPSLDPTIKQQQDFITILKQLHQQLSPLRQQLITLKRQHVQHNERRAQEKATYEIKVIRLEKEGELLREQNQMLKKKLGDVIGEKQTAKQLSDKIKVLEEEKARLQAKLILYEAVSVTDRTRVSSQTYSVLKQFQRKMQLITSTQPNQFIHHTQHNPSSHLHQLLTMKAYILQLDQKTKQLQLQNQKLQKKYLLIKQKLAQSNTLLQQSTSRQGTRLQLYRQRIQAYDKLVGKLTLQLQRHVGKMQLIQGRNSSVLKSKNITLNNNHKPSTQITLILNSYEQKMTNMAEQIMRLKKDNRQYEHQLTVIRQQLKSKTQQLELKIRELNDKERQIVVLKTQAITLNNSVTLLKRIIEEKEIGSGVNGDSKGARNSVNGGGGGGDSSGRDSAAMEEKVNRVRQVYEKQLHYKLSQLQQQKQLMISNMKQQHNQQLSQLGTQHEQQLQSKQNQLQQLNQLLISKQQQISQLLTSTQHLQSQLSQLHSHNTLLQSRLRQSQLVIQTKDQQLARLNDLLHKSNSQLQQQQKNIYEHKKNTYYNNIQTVNKNIGLSSSQQQLLEQNKQLHSRLYEGNVKMTSLQARLFNLNLQLQRVKSHNGVLQDRIEVLQAQIKQKNTAIFKLEDQCRSITNLRQAEQMARESAVRLYQNQIKNLKYTLMQLRMSQKEGGVRRLQQQNYLRPQSNTKPDISTQVPSPSTNLQSQLKQTLLQLQQKHLLVQQLTTKIQQLSSRLMQQQSQQQSSSMLEVNQQQYQKLRSQVQKLKAQEFVFRREKMGLQGEIQVKEGEISRLKHELWAIKLQSKRLQKYEREAEGNSNNDNRAGGWQENRNNYSDNLIPSPNQLSNHNHYQQQYQQLQHHDQQLPQQQPHPSLQYIPTNSPIKLSIPQNQTSALTITQQPSFNYSTNSNQQQTISSLQQRISQYQLLITQLQSELTQLKFTNQELAFHEQQNQEAMRMLNEEVFRLIDQVRYFERVINERSADNNVIRDSEQLEHELEERGNQGENRIEDSRQGNQHQLPQLNNYSINQTDSNHNDNSHNNPKIYPSSIHQATNNNYSPNPNPIAPTQAILQKIHRGQPMTSTQRQQLLTQDLYNMSLLIQHMNQDHSLKTQHLTTKLKQLQHQLMSKDLKISQLNRLLLQARIASNTSSNINISSVSQTGDGQQQVPSQFEYFITEIQRLTQLLKQRQRQLQDTKVMLDKYRSEKSRYEENLAVMVVMMVEVEAVRLQLSEVLEKVREKEIKEVQGNRVRENVQTINSSSMNQQFIKVLEGSHRHLVDYGQILKRNIANNGYNPTQAINNDRTSNTSSIPNIRQSLFSLSRPSQPQLYSNNSIQSSALSHNQIKLPPPTPTPTPTLPHPHPHPIDQIRHQQIQSYPSYPSQSGVSLNNISSTYSIRNPLKAYYRNAQSTYNPLSFSPPNNSKLPNITTQHKRTSSIQQHKEVKQFSNRTIQNDSNSNRQVSNHKEQIRYYNSNSKITQPLESYYKISESKNVESSYGQTQNDHKGEYYGYMLKNVNMIDSVGRDQKDIDSPNVYGKGQESPGYYSSVGARHKESLINSLAEERLGQDSMRYQKVGQESSKYNNINQGSGTYYTTAAYNYINNQPIRTSNIKIPSTSTITVHPIPYHPTTQTPLSFISSSKLSSSSNTHLPSSTSHLPTYPSNHLSSATLAQYYNSPLYQTNYNSTLDNSSSTYQQYLSKIG